MWQSALTTQTTTSVVVLEDPRGPIHKSLSLDHKVLANFQGLRILQTVRYVWSRDFYKFGYHHRAWGYGEEWLTYWIPMSTSSLCQRFIAHTLFFIFMANKLPAVVQFAYTLKSLSLSSWSSDLKSLSLSSGHKSLTAIQYWRLGLHPHSIWDSIRIRIVAPIRFVI